MQNLKPHQSSMFQMFPPFNEEDPFYSIAEFSNGFSTLDVQQKKSFCEHVHRFFMQKAYFDQNVPIPEQYLTRFSNTYLPLILSINAGSVKNAQLVATISKVTGTIFTELREKEQAYQILASHEAKERKIPESWGWIGRSSLKAFGLEKPRNGVIQLKDLQPTALQALIEIFFSTDRASGVEPLVDLMCFAARHKLSRLINILLDMFWRLDATAHQKLSNYAVKFLGDKDFFQALLFLEKDLNPNFELSKEETILLEKFHQEKQKQAYSSEKILQKIQAQDKPKIVFDQLPVESLNSGYFNEDDPYGSMARFTERFAALDLKGQQLFLNQARNFITQKAYKNEQMEIPKECKKRFAKIDGPFLLQCLSGIISDPQERQRLTANLQRISGIEIGVPTFEQVGVSTTSYTQTPQDKLLCWLPLSEANLLVNGLDPLLYQSLLEFQFINNKAELRSYASKTSLRDMFSLLAYALESNNAIFKRNISLAIRLRSEENAKSFKKVSTHLARIIDNEEVRTLFQNMPCLHPNHSAPGKLMLAHLLQFNLENSSNKFGAVSKENPTLSLKKIIDASAGTDKSKRWKIVDEYCEFLSNETLKLKLQLQKHLELNSFDEIFSKDSKIDRIAKPFLIATLQAIVAEKKPNFKEFHSSDAEKFINFLCTYETDAFFEKRGIEKAKEIIIDLLKKDFPYVKIPIHKSVSLEKIFEQFSPFITDAVKILPDYYQNASRKLVPWEYSSSGDISKFFEAFTDLLKKHQISEEQIDSIYAILSGNPKCKEVISLKDLNQLSEWLKIPALLKRQNFQRIFESIGDEEYLNQFKRSLHYAYLGRNTQYKTQFQNVLKCNVRFPLELQYKLCEILNAEHAEFEELGEEISALKEEMAESSLRYLPLVKYLLSLLPPATLSKEDKPLRYAHYFIESALKDFLIDPAKALDELKSYVSRRKLKINTAQIIDELFKKVEVREIFEKHESLPVYQVIADNFLNLVKETKEIKEKEKEKETEKREAEKKKSEECLIS